MKKVFTFLILLCANLVSYAQGPGQDPDGEVIAESGPAEGNWRIVKVNDNTYRLKPANANNQINFQNAPTQEQFKHGLGPDVQNKDEVAAQRKAALENCTGTLIVSGDFSNIGGFNNNYFGKFETVDLSGFEYSTTAYIYYPQFQQIEVGLSYGDNNKLKNYFVGAKTFTMAPEETVYMSFFDDNSYECKLETLNFTTGTKKIVGSDDQKYICDIKTLTVNFNNDLEEIGDWAFYYGDYDATNSTLITVTSFPESLKRIGVEAFHGTKIANANLSSCTSLEKLDRECFEDCGSLASVSFPTGSTFTYIGNDAFNKCKSLTTVDMSMCEGITEFQKNGISGDYKTFWACTSLTSFTFPPKISAVPGNQGLFKDCSNLATVTFTGTAKYENGQFVNPLVIENAAFSELFALTVVNFSNNLLRIEENAFNKCDIENVELQECHELVEIQKAAFKDCLDMINVDLCSHPKVIRTEAFRNVKSIKKVEIHGCENTCMTEVVCENRGFEWDITHNQTAAPSDVMQVVAELIFPKEGSVCNDANYTSAWDYFVGDYKSGALITQENLLCYYRYVPQYGASTTKVVGYVFDEDGNQIFNEDGTPKTQDYNNVPVECQYQTGNGWHEFIKVGFGEIIKPGEFLRTYSRTEGDGPCLLPNQIIAYRAIDYKSTKVGYVKDRTGNWYCVDTTQPEESRTYIQITDATDPADYAGKTRFSKLTIGGILYLRPLIAKVAQYNGVEGYTETNKSYFDNEEVYQNLQAVPGGHSYVPENTGVVLYSNIITEEAFLMLPGDFGTDVVYKEFPHTGDRYEEARRAGGNGVNTDDDINMLHGSYGTGWIVAPVYPWLFKGQTEETSGDEPANGTSYTGGHYSYVNAKAYRNFACTVRNTEEGTGKKTYGWKRLQPSVLKVNRAFAQIPANRFDNFNETVDQMPDFTLEDEIVEEDEQHSNLMIINMFEYESEGAGADGIKTVNTVEVNADNNAWYTLQGVRVAKPSKGLYINNGHKVVIK